MRQITVNIYKYDELPTKEAKEKAKNDALLDMWESMSLRDFTKEDWLLPEDYYEIIENLSLNRWSYGSLKDTQISFKFKTEKLLGNSVFEAYKLAEKTHPVWLKEILSYLEAKVVKDELITNLDFVAYDSIGESANIITSTLKAIAEDIEQKVLDGYDAETDYIETEESLANYFEGRWYFSDGVECLERYESGEKQ